MTLYKLMAINAEVTQVTWTTLHSAKHFNKYKITAKLNKC